MHVCTAIFLKWQINLALFVNKLRLGVMGTGKPFMYTKNSRGPQTEHRGTSLQTGIPGEMLLQFKLPFGFSRNPLLIVELLNESASNLKRSNL